MLHGHYEMMRASNINIVEGDEGVQLDDLVSRNVYR